jgi:predicted ABC-type ATPase
MDITEVEKLALEHPTYILIAGGIGVGKSHVVRQWLPKIPLMDIDEEMKRQDLEVYNEHNMLVARKSLGERIDQLKEQRRSLIAMGTASDTTFTINRLFWAKHDGYKTVLLHITCPLEQARKQNRLRARKGQRAVPREDEYLLTRTMTESEVTVSIVRHTDLVDHYVHVNNSQ